MGSQESSTRSRTARRAIIIGAGPAGLATAILLRRVGLETVVYERNLDDLASGNALTLWPNAFKALKIIGAADEVRIHSAPCEGLSMQTSAGEILQFVSRSTMESQSGGTGWALFRHDLVRILRDLLPADTVHFGARCVGIQSGSGGVVARFANGYEVEGDLLVGADGIRSAVRAALFGGNDLRYLGYQVARGIATYAANILPGQLSMGAAQQFGLFPLPDRQLYWFAAFNAPERNPAPDLGYLSYLFTHFANWHEPIADVIKATDPANLLVSDIYDRRPLRHWGEGATLLVGDAAHPSSPALGQGTCQAFEDAVALADCLAGNAEIATVLRTYEARRQRRANAITLQSRWMGRIGQWSNPVLCTLRNRLIKATSPRGQQRQLNQMFAFDSGTGEFRS